MNHIKHGQKVSFYNFAHQHYLAGHENGEVTCHRPHPGEGTTFTIHVDNSDFFHIETEFGGFLVAHDDGKFGSKGNKQHSRWRIVHARDGGVTLKAHNVDWFVGVSMFGHLEPIEHHTHDRCHWRVEIVLDDY